MFQKPIRRSNPNQKSNLRLFIRASSAMGGQGKQLVSSLNKPGQGGQEAHLRETLSWFSEGRFEAPFPCCSHPRREAAITGVGAVGAESRGSRRQRQRWDRSAESEGARGRGPLLLSGVLKSRGCPGRRRPLPSP